MEETKGVIYILTNPSFPEYVKIGYADDVKRRLKELNRSECTPFAFRLYAPVTAISPLAIFPMPAFQQEAVLFLPPS